MCKNKHTKQTGFTLIELIIVIVIIGILAAVAVPKYISLQTDAQQASTNGIAGNLGSASASNYAIKSGGLTGGVAIANCTAIGNLLQGGLDPAYTIGAQAIAANATATCVLTHTASTLTASFTGHGV